MIKITSIFLFLFISLCSFAQEEIDDVQKIFKTELAKAGQNVSFSNSASQRGIYLQFAGRNDHKLKGLPADAFYVNAGNNSIHIASTSVEGLKNGAYWYLHQLGFRYYFPHEAWHVVPRLNSIYKNISETVSPSYTYRRIWYAYGTGSDKATADYRKWYEANLQGGEDLSTGHSYDGIVNRNKAEFLKHPEYFAQKVSKGSIPRNPKFEVSNEGLVQIVIKDARQQILDAIRKKGKAPGMISLDPSDGGGFSTSAASKKIGGPSEQVFYLVNRVARALKDDYPDLKIGLYAYNLHAAPPSFDIEPNVTVLIATALNQSKYRTEELVELWRKKGVRVGLRDYYGVMAWDWDMPGQPRGSKINYIKRLKDEYNNGIRLLSAETNIGWISRGPAHYLAARLMWDVNLDADKVMNEFYDDMFGKAAPHIKALYADWENYRQEVPPGGDIFRWMQIVKNASAAESREDMQQRLLQIKQYLHYVVLYKQWKESPSDKNQVELFNYAYRLQDDGVVASYPLFRRLGNSYVDGKANMRFDDPKAVWKKNASRVSARETEQLLYSDMQSLDKKAVTMHLDYPGSFARLTNTSNKSSGIIKLRGRHLLILQVNDPSTANIHISSGLVKAKEYMDMVLRFYPYNTSLELNNVISEKTLKADQPLRALSLSFLKPGIYLLEVDDAKAGFEFKFSGNLRYGLVADDQRNTLTFSRNNMVFHVGKQVKEFTVVNNGLLTLVSPTGRTIDLQKKKGRIVVQVLNGETGTWSIKKQVGQFSLQGIMPLLSDSEVFLIRTDE